MKIHIYDVDRKLVEKYCKIISQPQPRDFSEWDNLRRKIHDEIFDSIGLSRALITRDERMFSICLNKIVCELTETNRIDEVKEVITPINSLIST